MAKRSAVVKNNRRSNRSVTSAPKRLRLKEIANNMELSAEERFQARLKLAEMPRNAHPTRVRNRCELTGRPRAFYRKFRLSRIALRELASTGKLAGVVKASW